MTKKDKENLIKYIRKTREMGFSVKEITDALLLAGWSRKQIQEGFESYGKKSFYKNLLGFVKKEKNIIKKETFVFKKQIKAKSSLFKKEGKFFYNKAHIVWHYFKAPFCFLVGLPSKILNALNRPVKKGRELDLYHDILPEIYHHHFPSPVFAPKDKKELYRKNLKRFEEKTKKPPLLSEKRLLLPYPNFKRRVLVFAEGTAYKIKSKVKNIHSPVKKSQLVFLKKIALSVLAFPFKATKAVLRESWEILKGDVVFMKNVGIALKRKAKEQEYLLKEEPSFFYDKLHIVWHYFVELVERLFKLLEDLINAVVKIILVPFVILNMLFVQRIKKSFKFKLKNVSLKKDSKKFYDIKEVSEMKFPEKISLIDIFRLSKRMFETKRLRTFLTILGMGVGIGTILFLVSLGYGLQNVLFERITSEDALLIVDAYPPGEAVSIELNDDIISQIQAIPEVDKIGKLVAVDGGISMENISVVATINVADKNFRSMSGEKLLAGEFQDDGVVVSAASAMLLGFEEDPKKAIGSEVSAFLLIPEKDTEFVKTYEIKDTYKITGVVDDPISSFAYFPMEKIGSSVELPQYSHIKIKAKDADFVATLKEDVVAFGLQVAALSDTLEQAKKIFSIARIVLGVFGIITLVVSAIGMLNTMTIALLERTQEIGIMKSIGASNLDIWKLFLAESFIMGFLGGIGGIAIGYAASEVFNYGINWLAQTFGGQPLDLFQQPLWFVVTIVIFASVVGLLTGFMPARRAAKLDPLMALKS